MHSPSLGLTYKLVFTTDNVGNVHVVGGWGQVFQLLLGENVESDQVNLCVTVLASLGGGHVDNLAWAALDDNEAVLSQGGTLHRVRGRGPGVGGLEGVLLMLWKDGVSGLRPSQVGHAVTTLHMRMRSIMEMRNGLPGRRCPPCCR